MTIPQDLQQVIGRTAVDRSKNQRSTSTRATRAAESRRSNIDRGDTTD